MNFDRNAARNAASSPSHRAQARSTAAVPISVYRELAAELQATQVMLDAMQGQNQHLRKQNLHLQQEVDSIVQAAKKMQSLVGGSWGGRCRPVL
ncbi:MAG: hypothetical protein HC824_03190 [Synechococcales cyanobacterium RM1_1_8]|nr:hypothetical protein [Synechococcales cyanobacterium RM1_1_8]